MRFPHVVVEVGRSGTRLLQTMLHSHREVSFLPEKRSFHNYVGLPFGRWSWRLRDPKAFRQTPQIRGALADTDHPVV